MIFWWCPLDFLHCYIDQFPIKLGILMGANLRRVDTWKPIVSSLMKMLSTCWKSRQLSIRESLTLINSEFSMMVLSLLKKWWRRYKCGRGSGLGLCTGSICLSLYVLWMVVESTRLYPAIDHCLVLWTVGRFTLFPCGWSVCGLHCPWLLFGWWEGVFGGWQWRRPLFAWE